MENIYDRLSKADSIAIGYYPSIIHDLGLDHPFVKGQDVLIKECWHFSTDGNAVSEIFKDEEDFRAGMNRVFVVWKKYNPVILAFVLMDTHVHFVLYGDYDCCIGFMHEYVRRTSIYMNRKYGETKKFSNLPINYQTIDNDFYLKVVICYVVKNATVGGLPFLASDYPWSSGPLYFRRSAGWATARWKKEDNYSSACGVCEQRDLLKCRETFEKEILVADGIVFPGEYVAYSLVERVYRTVKSFNYFMCMSKESEVEARGGTISHLSIPMQEMRMHRIEVSRELFGEENLKKLDTARRLRLAKALKARYNSSTKQIVRLCGLCLDEVKGMI